jgi:hypothetical protein
MNHYTIDGTRIDSVELKCLLVSRGVKVERGVYKRLKGLARLSVNPLCCNCLLLSDGTVVQLTDTRFHLRYLSGILSWDNLKLLRYIGDLETPFSLRMQSGRPVLLYENTELDEVSFPAYSTFYSRKTASGLPYTGNAVLQGTDWVAFQCLWPCETAAAGKPCQFCFSGGDFENAAVKGKALPQPFPPGDAAEIVGCALANEGVSHVQLTGGSTFDGAAESKRVLLYLEAIAGLKPPGEILLYITPPADTGLMDEYFRMGAGRIACSLELWDIARAKAVTPGKIDIIGRERYLTALTYASNKYGKGKAFSNFILGIEGFDTLAAGTAWLAERGVMPAASVWMPMGRPVMGSMKPPGVDFYRRVKEHYAGLYVKYGLEPTESRGLNVCIGRDFWRYSQL